MSNDNGKSTERRFDLEERTAKFGEAVVRFVKSVQLTAVTNPIVSQLVRSATSIGANYCEADDSGSRKEFLYRISICKRESRETKHWLRMLVAALPDSKEDARTLWIEAKELHLIFASIFRGRRSKSFFVRRHSYFFRHSSFDISHSQQYARITNNDKTAQHRHDRLRIYGPRAFERVPQGQ
jgi:four helix bundle protein